MTTQADLQNAVDQAAPGSTVRFPAGTYKIDAVNAPLTLKSDITLDLTGVTLVAIPNDQTFSMVVKIAGCKNVTILGGTIRGERDTHLGSTDWAMGGAGGGIVIHERASNIKIQDTRISDSFGDGILIWHASQVEVSGVVSDHNRRQGMSVVGCDGLHVVNSQFSNSGGTPPGCGIDLENDAETEAIRNVLVEKCVFYENAGSCIAFGSAGAYSNCRVAPDNDFDMKTQPIWAGGNARPLGTPWWALLLNRMLGSLSGYRWWGYPIQYYHA